MSFFNKCWLTKTECMILSDRDLMSNLVSVIFLKFAVKHTLSAPYVFYTHENLYTYSYTLKMHAKHCIL